MTVVTTPDTERTSRGNRVASVRLDGRAAADGGAPFRVLTVHNRYQQPGGEDSVFAAETELLTIHGHAVHQLTFDNDAIASARSALGAARLGWTTVWSQHGYDAVRDAIRAFRPDVVHFHNTFPLISPAGYYAARAERVPVVQTLHNFRLLCPSGTFFRDGHVCEDCLGKAVPLPAIAHACYRDSRSASGASVAMLSAHRALRTWTRLVDRYIVLGEFARQIFMRGGLPADKLAIKDNFVPDATPGDGHGNYALFVGRLAREKGIQTLLGAWERLGGRIPLKIVGDGPLAADVAAAARRDSGIEWLGQLSPDAVRRAMRDAAVLVFPSVWYEGQPRTILEAFAVGTPVLASNLGATAELVQDGDTGRHFHVANTAHLAQIASELFSRPADLARMRGNARTEFEERYTGEANYRRLIDIYSCARKEGRHLAPRMQ